MRPAELREWIRHDSTRSHSMCEEENVFGVLKKWRKRGCVWRSGLGSAENTLCWFKLLLWQHYWKATLFGTSPSSSFAPLLDFSSPQPFLMSSPRLYSQLLSSPLLLFSSLHLVFILQSFFSPHFLFLPSPPPPLSVFSPTFPPLLNLFPSFSSLLLLHVDCGRALAEKWRWRARQMLANRLRRWRSQSCSNVNSSNKKIPKTVQHHLHAVLLWIKWSHKWNLSCKAYMAIRTECSSSLTESMQQLWSHTAAAIASHTFTRDMEQMKVKNVVSLHHFRWTH